MTRNIQRNCMGCHAVGYEQYTDTDTGEVLCDTVEDPTGEYDIDGDGQHQRHQPRLRGLPRARLEHITAAGGALDRVARATSRPSARS